MVTGQVRNKSPSSQLILSISNNFHLRPIKKIKCGAMGWGWASMRISHTYLDTPHLTFFKFVTFI